jgi:hypothetical protein
MSVVSQSPSVAFERKTFGLSHTFTVRLPVDVAIMTVEVKRTSIGYPLSRYGSACV